MNSGFKNKIEFENHIQKLYSSSIVQTFNNTKNNKMFYIPLISQNPHQTLVQIENSLNSNKKVYKKNIVKETKSYSKKEISIFRTFTKSNNSDEKFR